MGSGLQRLPSFRIQCSDGDVDHGGGPERKNKNCLQIS